MTMIEYGGKPRLVVGRTRYATPPEPGTVVGPRDITGEYLVVLGQDGEHTQFGYATVDEQNAAAERRTAGEARSMAELVGGQRRLPHGLVVSITPKGMEER